MWTTPHDWSNEKVTASLMGLVRDDFLFLYSPPFCRTTGLEAPEFVLGAWLPVGFPKTLSDNDMMRALSGTVSNEPESAFIEVQTPGKYLASTVVGFKDVAPNVQDLSGQQWPAGQVIAVTVRSAPGVGAAFVGRSNGGRWLGGGPNIFIPVVGAWPCGAGFQWHVQVLIPAVGSGDMITAWGAVPYFYVTWIGSP